MICKQCATRFVARHFNQSMCSDKCRAIGRKIAKARYKDSAKGMESERRWRKSPRKKATDKKYHTSEKGRAKAVDRVARLIRDNVYYLERKRLGQRAAYRDLKAKMIAVHAACQRCGTTDRLTIDHIKPMSLGGKHEPDNLQVLCRSCNASKGQRTVKYGL